jgi:hypothetical protein
VDAVGIERVDAGFWHREVSINLPHQHDPLELLPWAAHVRQKMARGAFWHERFRTDISGDLAQHRLQASFSDRCRITPAQAEI